MKIKAQFLIFTFACTVSHFHAQDDLLKRPDIRKTLDYNEKNYEGYLKKQVKNAEIPAPLFKEKVRVRFMAAEFKCVGLNDVHTDKDENILGWRRESSDRTLVIIPKWLRKEKPGKFGDGTGSSKGNDYGKKLEGALADEKKAVDLQRDIAHVIDRRGGAKNIVVMECSNKGFEGKSLAELAKQKNIPPVEMAIKLQTLGDRKRPGGVRMRSYSMLEVDAESLGVQTWTATATDGFIMLPEDGPAHARYYGTFSRKIRHYAVVEESKVTGNLPANILLRQRGHKSEVKKCEEYYD